MVGHLRAAGRRIKAGADRPLKTQRFIKDIKNWCNGFSVASYLDVYVYWRGIISHQWSRWEAVQLSGSGPNSYRGCDDRIQSALWLLSGIQMPIPQPSAISSPSSLPSSLPQCLSGLVISCHPLQRQITPHTACFPLGACTRVKQGNTQTNTQMCAHACKLKALKNSVKIQTSVSCLCTYLQGRLIHAAFRYSQGLQLRSNRV